MTTDYDPIAEQYRRCKLHPWRTHVECFTFLELIGDLKGKSVIDLACGEGFYTRMLRHRGAAKTTGVDLSQGMIDLAKRQEAEQNLGIEYLVGDCKDLHFSAEYDLAVAAFLLNYAQNRGELEAMCNGIARCLKPGGRFVTVNSSPALDFRSAPSYRQYGFEVGFGDDLLEGKPITWTIFLEDSSFTIENYYIDVPTHEQVLRKAGFKEIRWHPPKVSADGMAQWKQEYWKVFLERPPVAFIECRK